MDEWRLRALLRQEGREVGKGTRQLAVAEAERWGREQYLPRAFPARLACPHPLPPWALLSLSLLPFPLARTGVGAVRDGGGVDEVAFTERAAKEGVQARQLQTSTSLPHPSLQSIPFHLMQQPSSSISFIPPLPLMQMRLLHECIYMSAQRKRREERSP